MKGKDNPNEPTTMDGRTTPTMEGSYSIGGWILDNRELLQKSATIRKAICVLSKFKVARIQPPMQPTVHFRVGIDEV